MNIRQTFLKTSGRLLFLTLGAVFASSADSAESLSFAGTTFEYRSSNGELVEFTPSGQEDLASWEEMISLVYAPRVRNEAELETLASELDAAYQKDGRRLKAEVSPPTESTSSKYLLVAVMTRNGMAEAIFARASIQDSMGIIAVYSRRLNAENLGAFVVEWFEKNGNDIEAELMGLQSLPARSAFGD